MRATAVSIHELHKEFRARGKQAVVANEALSFDVYRSEIFGLLGPNGAGKTTLILQLLGLLAPTSGSITVEGIDVVRHPERVKGMAGFMPQQGVPMRYISVERALRYTGRLRGQSEGDAKSQSDHLIDALDLRGSAQREVNTLSGGMQRLVNFAMALMGNPRLLVLDEPTNELDPHHRRVVWDMIGRLVSGNQGVTCILVTHNVLEAERVVNRVGVMQEGRLIALGTPGAIKARIGSAVRIEFRLKEGESALAISQRDRLLRMGSFEHTRDGGYRLYIEPDCIGIGVETVLQTIGLDRIDDFRIAPPSLEDAYLAIEESTSPPTPRSTSIEGEPYGTLTPLAACREKPGVR
ncbi:MAG: ABC transporter ATP-binding protein [Anaerolineae bacterium]|nr:ABC transporter ATP-binding protein [Anaerolineae bacterium]